ncbi:MAG: efflux RND transporter permease subunit [candidate division Zixibacteria bacterium]|nr:efflux RND transporter permease subunit [candidate division Zixibacteria bacterium]
MKLSDISVKRPVFATMMVGALLVLGLFSYYELEVNLLPDVDFPITIVKTIYPGAASETVETEVSKKVEDAINEISGIQHITSRSQEGFSLIIVKFELYRDGFECTQEVREKVAGIRASLPDDIEEPLVQNFDPDAQPIISMAISGERSVQEITEIAKNTIKKRLETIKGVGNIELIGGQDREILIALNPEEMESFKVSTRDITSAISAANINIPGGRVDESSREYTLRMAGRLKRVSDFDNIIVKNKKGIPVYLKDVAAVSDSVAEQRSYSSYDMNTAVSLSVTKQSGANTVDMAHKVKSVIGSLGEELPSDISIEVVQDYSTFIEDSIHEVLFNIQIGTILAILVIFLFLLDYRPTIIAGLSIPISLIATFTIMNSFGFMINMMTLMGLSLSVGILVDDAIVVMENIYRHIDMGKPPMKAAIEGTKEIGLAVTATTFSVVVVFLPVAYMKGMVGQFFFEFGITVAFAVLISLFVAFSLTPMLSSRWLYKMKSVSKKTSETGLLLRLWYAVRNILSFWSRAFDNLKPKYERLLAASLRKRWLVILIAVGSIVLAGFMVQFVGSEFMAKSDQNKLIVTMVTPPGTNLEETTKRFKEAENQVRNLKEVANTFITIGEGNEPVSDGTMLVKLIDRSERELSARQLVDSVRILLVDIAGARISVGDQKGEGGGKKPVELSIRGNDLQELKKLAHKVQKIVNDIPGTVDVDNTMEEGKPEIQVNVDRRLADDLGLNLYQIPATVRTLVEGEVVSTFKEGSEEYDVRVRLEEKFRSSMDDIGRVLIKGDKKLQDGSKPLFPLGRVASMEKTSSIGQHNRYDRQREVRVNANITSWAFAGTVMEQVMEKVNQISLSPGYVIEPVGEAELMKKSFTNIFRALILSIIFIYLLLASQYESFFDPFSIMISLPLSLVGAIFGLVGSSFSIMSLIGIILLMGLVTKNAILLIDFVKQERAKGVPRNDAILRAGPIRLRPILMTALATIFGMLPLALGIGPGAEMRAPMARAVIGGMLSSTLLTLVVVPVVYTLIDDFIGLFRQKKDSSGLKEDEVAIHRAKHIVTG